MKYQILTGITILKPADGSDCTNKGISSSATTAALVVREDIKGAYGPIDLLGGAKEIDLTSLRGPVFELIRRDILGVPYFHAQPLGEKRWTMFGGNYLEYSGNGFHSICQYPIAIHDRIEE